MANEKDLESNRELRAQLEPFERRARLLGEALTGELHERTRVRYFWRNNGGGWSATLEVTIEEGISRPDFDASAVRVLAFAEGRTMPEAAGHLVGTLTELSQRRAARIHLAFKEEK